MKQAIAFCLSMILLPAAMAAAQPRTSDGGVALFPLDIPVNPIAVRYLQTGLSRAQRDGASVALLEVVPKGGDATSVAAMVALIEKSPLPVVVRIEGKSVGSQTPAAYLERAGDKRALPEGARERLYPVGALARVLSAILDPNIAYALLIIGIVGLAVEMSIPGFGLPGVAGLLSLLISLVALGLLSADAGGILVVLLGFGLFVFDIKAPTHGILTAGGLVALLFGSLLLFPSWRAASLPGLVRPHISIIAIAAATTLIGALFATALSIGVRAQRRKVAVGGETLVGLSGTAVTDLVPAGIVRVGHEEWSATAVGDDVLAGEEVDVVAFEGIRLVVMHRL